jgi:hypothetical protein
MPPFLVYRILKRLMVPVLFVPVFIDCEVFISKLVGGVKCVWQTFYIYFYFRTILPMFRRSSLWLKPVTIVQYYLLW